MCFKINSEKILKIYSVLIPGNYYLTIEIFYNIVCGFLFDDEDFNNPKYLEESPYFYKYNNLMLQVTGNCTVISVFTVIGIILNENNTNTELSQVYYNIYTNTKKMVLSWCLEYFNIEKLKDKFYKEFIKLNETFLITKEIKYESELGNRYNKVNEKYIKKLYDFYVDRIKNSTNINNFEYDVDEKKCTKISKFQKYEKNNNFNLDFINIELEINQEKLDNYIIQLDNLIKIMNDHNIIDFESFEQLLNYLNNYMEIIEIIAKNTNDILLVRLKQYQVLNISYKLYNSTILLIEQNRLNKQYDLTKIIELIHKIILVFHQLNIYVNVKISKSGYVNNVNYFDLDMDNDKKNNNPLVYKKTIYSIFIIHFIFIVGKIYDHLNTNKFLEEDEKINENIHNFCNGFYIENNN